MAEKNKTIKILLAIATMWPVTYLCLFFVCIFASIAQVNMPENNFIIFALFHVFTMLWMFGLIAIYIIDIFKHPGIAGDMKVLWAVIIFFGNMFATPVYWYMHVWRRQPPAPAAQTASVNPAEAVPQPAGQPAPAIFCTQCGSRNNPQSRFCMACGNVIET